MQYKEAINWNKLEDEIDKTVWEKLISQFWVATEFPISNDLATWRSMDIKKQLLVLRVFAGLTLLDTIQGSVGSIALLSDAATPHEEAVLTNIAFMEHIHAQTYSQIFQTLSSTPEINAAFEWSKQNPHLQEKAQIIQNVYAGKNPLKKKAASVILESFLFYSGFFLPLWLNGHAELTNTADAIKFIIRDEAIHGYYVGYKFNQAMQKKEDYEREEIEEWVYTLIDDLYKIEVKYAQELYDDSGLTDEVLKFCRYNANKALMNMQLEPLFPKEEINPIVLNGLSLNTETGDFFSARNTYSKGKKEATTDEDWDF